MDPALVAGVDSDLVGPKFVECGFGLRERSTICAPNDLSDSHQVLNMALQMRSQSESRT